jgi:hypothetical protein
VQRPQVIPGLGGKTVFGLPGYNNGNGGLPKFFSGSRTESGTLSRGQNEGLALVGDKGKRFVGGNGEEGLAAAGNYFGAGKSREQKAKDDSIISRGIQAGRSPQLPAIADAMARRRESGLPAEDAAKARTRMQSESDQHDARIQALRDAEIAMHTAHADKLAKDKSPQAAAEYLAGVRDKLESSRPKPRLGVPPEVQKQQPTNNQLADTYDQYRKDHAAGKAEGYEYSIRGKGATRFGGRPYIYDDWLSRKGK